MSFCTRHNVLITGDLVPGSGNSTTAARLGEYFSHAGFSVQIIHAKELPSYEPVDVLFVLAIHAYKGGLPASLCPRLRTVPLWILLSGTDMNEDIVVGKSDRRSIIEFVCRRAHRVIAVSPGVARQYEAFVASVDESLAGACITAQGESLSCDRPLAPCQYIPSAVDLPETLPLGVATHQLTTPAPLRDSAGPPCMGDSLESDMRLHLGLEPSCNVALLVASIRTVKSPGFLLAAVLSAVPPASSTSDCATGGAGTMSSAAAASSDSLRTAGPQFALVVVGPILDDSLRSKLAAEGLVDAACACHPARHGHLQSSSSIAVYHPPLPRKLLLAWLRQADVAVNSSESEGQSNAVLEAMFLGVPVAARRVEGNADLILDGSTGLLFDTPEEGVQQCLHLCGLKSGKWTAGSELAARARSWAQEAHSVAAEAAAWTELLRADGLCDKAAP